MDSTNRQSGSGTLPLRSQAVEGLFGKPPGMGHHATGPPQDQQVSKFPGFVSPQETQAISMSEFF